MEAYEEALEKTSTKHAPWFVIPANHKWYRDLVISRIVVDTLEEMKLKLPPTRVDLKEIAKKYHAAEERERTGAEAFRELAPSLRAERNLSRGATLDGFVGAPRDDVACSSGQ